LQAAISYEKAQKSGVPQIVEQAKHLVESSITRLQIMGLNDEIILSLLKAKLAAKN